MGGWKSINRDTQHWDGTLGADKFVGDGNSLTISHTILDDITANDHHAEAHTHKLNEIENPDASKVFNLGNNKTLGFTSVDHTPVGDQGIINMEAKGAFSGSLLHIHQHTGNPGATELVTIETEDADVLPLKITSANAAGLNMDTSKIINVVDPTADQEAATKKYVDDKEVESFPTSLTAGSVIFSDGVNLQEDNLNLYWDNVNKELQPNLIRIESDGSQAYPALKFNDTNTGFFRSGDSIRLSINNSTKMIVDGDGHVTISSGDLRLAKGQAIQWDNSNQNIRFTSEDTPHLRIKESGADRFAIKDGKVGIGTNNPSSTLEVNGDINLNNNYAMEGYSTGRNVLRSLTVRFDAGDTPNTNINCTGGGWSSFNEPTYTNGTNIEVSQSDGSFSLSADGKTITLNLAQDVKGILSIHSQLQKLVNASTTKIYYPSVNIVAGNLVYTVRERGNVSLVNWLSILAFQDQIPVCISFITSS